MYYLLAKSTLIFDRFKRLFNGHSRLGLISFVFLGLAIITALFLYADNFALAQVITSKSEFGEAIIDAVSSVALSVATLFLKLSIFVLKFIIEIGGYNGYIHAPAVNVGWVMVRDLANMVFVVALLLIAFGTILGLEQYEWKKLMVKLFFAAILVNFSRVICGLMIDAAQVVMMTFINGVVATAGGNLINAFNLDGIMKLSGKSAEEAKSIADNKNVFMAAVAGVVFAGMVLATMLVYLFILLSRMVVLWVLVILSPLAFVLTIIPQTQDRAKEWWSQFGGNLIVGPMLAFFLWLSFVAVGSGTAQTHLSDTQYSSLPASQLSSGAADIGKVGSSGSNSGAVTSAGITDSMTWESMANFFIAISMLILGARQAQKTGAEGAAAMSKVTDFGKKVGTIASGVAVGNWMYDKGAAGLKRGASAAGKFGFMKTPLIGGDAWKRRGKYIAGRFSNWKTKKDIGRDVFLQDKISDANKQGGARGWLKKQAWTSLSSATRKDAVAENWTKTAEFAKKEHEARISTSKMSGGTDKLEARRRAERYEGYKEAHGKRKGEEEDLRLDSTEEFKELTKKIIDDERRSTQASETVSSRKENEATKQKLTLAGKKQEDILADKAKQDAIASNVNESKKVREAAKKQSEKLKIELKFKTQGEDLLSEKAAAEQGKFDLGEHESLALAKARDKVLIENNKAHEAVYEDNELAKQSKEKIERHSTGDAKAAGARIKKQLALIKEANQQMNATTKDSKEEEEAKVKVQSLRKGLAEIYTANLGRNVAFAEGAKQDILKELGQDQSFSVDVDDPANGEMNLYRMQAQELACLTGEAIDVGDSKETAKDALKVALKKFNVLFGERAGSMMEQVRLNCEKSAGEGGLGYAGQFRMQYNEETKQLQTVLTASDDDKDKDTENNNWRDYISGRRLNATSTAKITRIDGFGGTVDKDSDGNSKLDSDASIDGLAQMLSGLTGNNAEQVNAYTKDDLASVLQHSDTDKIKALVKKLSAANDPRAVKKLFKLVIEKNREKLEKAMTDEELGEDRLAEGAHLKAIEEELETLESQQNRTVPNTSDTANSTDGGNI